jgi:hypothetical protein
MSARFGRLPATNAMSTDAVRVPHGLTQHPQPNPAGTPAADRKLGGGDDLTKIQWFGWLDTARRVPMSQNPMTGPPPASPA